MVASGATGIENNLVADGSRSRLSRWLTARWVGSRFQRSLHGHAVQGNIWSMSKVFRLRGRSVQAQCRLPASTTLSATCRARDTSRAGSDQRIAANIFVSARGRFCPLAYSRISLIHSAISVGSIQAAFRRIERQRWPGTRMPRPESGAAACRGGAGALYHRHRLQAQGDSRAAGRAGDARRRAAQHQ